jgi:branched-chain amino acid aminotransferase
MTDRLEKVHYINMDGNLIPFKEAKIHPLNTAMKYAASVFDAWRAYWNEEQGELYVFRLKEHLERLIQSAKICHIPCPYNIEEMICQTLELIKANDFKEDLHCRLILFVNQIDGGLFSVSPISTLIAAMPAPQFFRIGTEGVHCCVSSWRRISDDNIPPRVKAAANYQNSRLAGLEALADGYDSVVILDGNGKVTEGPGYCIFIVRNGVVLTPPVTSGILESVTRDAIITLFQELDGRKVVERVIDRTELYIADEAFFCGSTAEVTPILSIDKHQIGNAKMGSITREIREAFLNVAKGKSRMHRDWLIPVYGK